MAMPASPATKLPLKSATFLRLNTSPDVVMLEIPRSATLRPSTENGYVLPPNVSVPSPQLTPTPKATALLDSFTVPEGAGSAAIAPVDNTATQPNANNHFEVSFFNIAFLL